MTDFNPLVKNFLNSKIQAELDDLRGEIEDLDPKLKEEMDKIQDNLNEVSSNSEKEQLNKPLNKLGRFLKELDDPNSNFSKIIKGTQKGIEYTQKLDRTYNNITNLPNGLQCLRFQTYFLEINCLNF